VSLYSSYPNALVMNLSHRVVARYTEKRAGTFQAPPAMVKTISEWVQQLYAGNVLAKIEADLEKRHRWLERGRESAEKHKAILGSLAADIKALPDKKTLRYEIWHYGGWETLAIRRKGDAYQIGQGEDRIVYSKTLLPRAKVVPKVRSLVKRGLKEVEKEEVEDAKDEIAAAESFKKECQKYTSRAKRYKSKAKKVFHVDLTGWRYLDRLERGFEKINPGKSFGPSALKKWLKEDEWDKITVVLNFQARAKSSGDWTWWKKELTVDAQRHGWSGEDFEEGLGETLRTLRHELQHVGQDVLGGLLSLGGKAGVPAQKLTAPSRERKQWELREEEFYPQIADAVDDFMTWLKRFDDPDLREMFDNWIEGEFFGELRKHEPAKWRKAVKEFVKGLEDAGIRIPGK